uniref:EOG090X0HEX n=1 Tax=Ceriodaphnia reticulata TaxID=302197 RepID=A0A4Y7LYB1_9CRUS|nr:EOG090X0HEX [Ceriodaphnia reticulata]
MMAMENKNTGNTHCGCDPYLLSLVETKEGPTFKKASRSTGLLLASITGGAAIALSVVCYPFVSPALRRVVLPYVPASTKQVENVMKALSNSNMVGGRKMIDLGSGDGRIVLAAGQRGFQSHGVELNSVLVLYSKFTAWRQRIKNATFSRQDLFKVDYTKYNNIVIFGVEEMMPELEALFEKSLVSSSQVIACRFPFPNWKPSHVIGEGIDTVWVYEV